MKKFLIILFSFFSPFIVSNQTQARSVADFSPAIDEKVASMKTTQDKVDWLQMFSDLLNTPTFTRDRYARLFKDIRNYSLNMLAYFQQELKQENEKKSDTNTRTTWTFKTNPQTTVFLPTLSNNFPNIDEKKVRDAILDRHNDERDVVWVNDYKYNTDLEWSAIIRANKLASESKTTKLHVRQDWDGTYNYNSILNRFSDLWISFPASVKWAASFSESVWYGYYKCSKSDCTQDLINAVKKTRTWLIMKEKSYNWSHYRAATLKHFIQMGAWIAIDKSKNRYYIVFHYGVDF